MINAGVDTVRAWADAPPGLVSHRFHNLLLWQLPELRRLLDLFALPLPAGHGRYNHHDGRRP